MQGGFDVFENQFNKQGMKMDIQRKMPDGSYVPASESQVNALKTRARMTTFAEALKGMSLEEKTACALDMKNAANQLYDDQEYAEATQCYLQALTAASFGGAKAATATATAAVGDGSVGIPGGPDAEAAEGGEDVSRVEELDEDGQRIEDLGDLACLSRTAEDNVDPLVVPCLNNLSASCIALKEYGKAILFARQVLELRPTGPGSVKAHLRIGRSELELGRYREATSVLESLLARTADVSGGKDGKEVEVVGEADRGRAKIFLERCKAGLAKEERNMQKRKVGMRKAFHGDSGGGGGGSKGKSKVKGKSKGKEKDEDEEGDAAAATATSLMAEATTQEEPPKPKMLPVYALMLGFFVIFIGIAKAGLAAIGAGGPSYLDRLKDQDREMGLPEF